MHLYIHQSIRLGFKYIFLYSSPSTITWWCHEYKYKYKYSVLQLYSSTSTSTFVLYSNPSTSTVSTVITFISLSSEDCISMYLLYNIIHIKVKLWCRMVNETRNNLSWRKYLKNSRVLGLWSSSTSTSTSTEEFLSPSTSTSTSTWNCVLKYEYEYEYMYLDPSLQSICFVYYYDKFLYFNLYITLIYSANINRMRGWRHYWNAAFGCFYKAACGSASHHAVLLLLLLLFSSVNI